VDARNNRSQAPPSVPPSEVRKAALPNATPLYIPGTPNLKVSNRLKSQVSPGLDFDLCRMVSPYKPAR